MARRRKKSLTNRVFSEATRALPGPVQVAFATPFRAMITLIVIGALMSYGVIHIQFQDGRPKLTVDQQKAAELKKTGMDWISKQETRIEEQFVGEGEAPKHSLTASPFAKRPTEEATSTGGGFHWPTSAAKSGRGTIRRD